MVSKVTHGIPRGRRAVSDELKQRRREDLRESALRLLARGSYESISMQAVAAEAGVAKGTSYLYFATREALFLSLLADHYAAWFAWFQNSLAEPVADPDRWARTVARDLAGRPQFLRLAGLLHRVLEQNVPVGEIVAFKQALAGRLAEAAGLLEQAMDFPQGSGERLLTWLQAVAPTLAQMAEPAPALRQALASEPALSRLTVDFVPELHAWLIAAMRGLKEPSV